MTSEQLKTIESMASAILAEGPTPTPGRIREVIEGLRNTPFTKDVTDEQSETLARVLEERHDVTMKLGSVLTDAEYEPWLEQARASIAPYYWNRYRRLLVDDGFSNQVIASLDEITDRVLGLMENPEKNVSWDRRGMVVGHVQSGKTANYTGLICKAADAGYKLIVVIAGIHNNLRNQTQERIDQGFIGVDSANLMSARETRAVGVGRFNQSRRPATLTNRLRDFNKSTATAVGIQLRQLQEPAVLVIKKNSSTLQNLLEWLREHSAAAGSGKVDEPMLLIDDEADNASINVSRGPREVSRINGQIRQLLQLFTRRCYVGYTATPFANIFIDPDNRDEMVGHDLFPRNFMVSLDPPSNYFGPSKVFDGDERNPYVRYIADNGDTLPIKHKIDHEIVDLPPSLKTAINAFILAKAIRIHRGQGRQHCSMLVNASRFTRVQTQLRNQIHSDLQEIVSAIRVNGALDSADTLNDPVIGGLKKTFDSEFASARLRWETLYPLLLEAAAPIGVVTVNSASSGKLNYRDHSDHGLNVIAVGGYSLSRGLTLEGLTTSYFLRDSKMYDTLMQMGRWFGYRPGYEDLCRIWMPEEVEGWYEHIGQSIDQLRAELRQMEAVNATPEDFGLRVRSHPDSLLVTARNKMGTGERVHVSIGLSKSLIETATLHGSTEIVDRNLTAARNLFTNLETDGRHLGDAEEVGGGLLLRNVELPVVQQFLTEFVNHLDSIKSNSGPVLRYIEQRPEEMAHWDLFVPSLRSDNPDLEFEIGGRTIVMRTRTAGQQSSASKILVTEKQRVASRGDERIGLSDEEIEQAHSNYRREKEDEGTELNAGNVNYPDRVYRAQRSRPLLMLHLLKIIAAGSKVGSHQYPSPVVAWSISFPATNKPEVLTEYVVNTTWLREQFQDDLEDEELQGDDGDV